MCDYSAKAAKKRDAAKHDKLVTGKISYHTAGFLGIADPLTAVCLLPGAELAFDKPVRYQFQGGILETPQLVARFRQVEKGNTQTHHDALEFADGLIVKLNSLELGQTATVLQLPAKPKTKAEAEEQRRAEYV
jgi:hypothetical protein